MRRNGKNNTQPPAISVSPLNRITLRFTAASSSGVGGFAVSVQDLYDILCIATSASAAKRLVSALRVRKIELWGNPASTANLVGIRDLSITPQGGRNQVIFDEHLGADRPAHVLYRPPKGSMAADWLTSTQTSILFGITVTAGSIVDLTFEYLLGYQAGTSALASVGAAITSTLGTVLIRAMDSNNVAGLVPTNLVYQTA